MREKERGEGERGEGEGTLILHHSSQEHSPPLQDEEINLHI